MKYEVAIHRTIKLAQTFEADTDDEARAEAKRLHPRPTAEGVSLHVGRTLSVGGGVKYEVAIHRTIKLAQTFEADTDDEARAEAKRLLADRANIQGDFVGQKIASLRRQSWEPVEMLRPLSACGYGS